MSNLLSEIFAVVFVILFIIDACLIFLAYIYSRFIFNGYLKKHHQQKWEELVYSDEYHGANWRAFDKTPQMWKFRIESNDDLRDPKLNQLRKTSIRLLEIGIGGWLGLLILFIAVAVIDRLFGR